jgi:hypothetical protein
VPQGIRALRTLFSSVGSTKYGAKYQVLIISEGSPKALLCSVGKSGFGYCAFPNIRQPAHSPFVIKFLKETGKVLSGSVRN